MYLSDMEIETIKSSWSGEDVADLLNLDVVIRGNRKYIYCPAHPYVLGKQDNELGNCILTDRGCHCFSCNTSTDVIDMVRYELGVPFYKAINILSGDVINSEGRVIKKNSCYLPLKKEEFAFLGIPVKRNYIYTSVSYEKPRKSDYSKEEIDCITVYTTRKKVPLYILDLYQNDTNEFWDMVSLKTFEKAERIQKTLDFLEPYKATALFGPLYYEEKKNWKKLEKIVNTIKENRNKIKEHHSF